LQISQARMAKKYFLFISRLVKLTHAFQFSWIIVSRTEKFLHL